MNTAEPPPSSPARHLLRMIVDALDLPAPTTPEGQAARLALLDRRAALVLDACHQALRGQPDYAARDLFGAVSGTQPTYQRVPANRAGRA
jgi:hypothetical protein